MYKHFSVDRFWSLSLGDGFLFGFRLSLIWLLDSGLSVLLGLFVFRLASSLRRGLFSLGSDGGSIGNDFNSLGRFGLSLCWSSLLGALRLPATLCLRFLLGLGLNLLLGFILLFGSFRSDLLLWLRLHQQAGSGSASGQALL